MNPQIKSCIELLQQFDGKEIQHASPEEERDWLRTTGSLKMMLHRAAMGWQLHELSIDGTLDSRRLEDGRVIDLVRDPEHPECTRFVCWKDGAISYEGRITVDLEWYLPRQVKAGAFQSVPLPVKAEPYGSLPELIAALMEVIQRSVWVANDSARLLAHFVIATWFADRLPVAPYLAVVGVPETGKTTLLRMLELLCRRGILAPDISSEALLQACDVVRATLLIDEVSSVRGSSNLRRMLRIGNAPSGLVLRKDRAWNLFSPKVISWRELPDDPALTGRCVIIPMREVNDPKLLPPGHPEIVAAAGELQEKLLFYRLAHFDELSVPALEGSEKLNPRARDLYRAMAAPCAAHPEICKELLEHFLDHNESALGPLSVMEEAALAALFQLAHGNPGQKFHFIKDVAHTANRHLKEAGERRRVIPRQVSTALAGLGFTNRRRANHGSTIVLNEADRRRLNEMAERYGTL